jgi:hypothetical protein
MNRLNQIGWVDRSLARFSDPVGRAAQAAVRKIAEAGATPARDSNFYTFAALMD